MARRVSATCPNCGSAAYRGALYERTDGLAAALDDRVCEACGTRYTPPTPRWVAVAALLCGLGLLGIGAVGLVAFGRVSVVLMWIVLLPGSTLVWLAVERFGERVGASPGGFPVLLSGEKPQSAAGEEVARGTQAGKPGTSNGGGKDPGKEAR